MGLTSGDNQEPLMTAHANMVAQGSTFTVDGMLGNNNAFDFETAVLRFVGSTDGDLTLDLTQVTRIVSMCIGTILVAHFACEKTDNSLLVRASNDIARDFEFANLHKILNVEFV
jgi:anti-anti-sigma regulatory factor